MRHDFDEGDIGEWTAEQKSVMIWRLSDEVIRLKIERDKVKGELKGAEYASLAYRTMLEKGRNESMFKRIYTAIFKPNRYGQ